jgi:YrbI family 3-deoxy-D-manno-octulosonate 8-phosphate phosphatase
VYKQTILLRDVEAIVTDFDGVLTDNKVQIDQYGKEMVSCSRADGLAFDVLRKINVPVYILSTEKNPVVAARANKLRVDLLQGVEDKKEGTRELANKYGLNLGNTLYLGNDLNDYHAMQLCGYSACPADSHLLIKEISTIILKTSGGNGVVRELLEDVFGLNFLNILYSDKKSK